MRTRLVSRLALAAYDDVKVRDASNALCKKKERKKGRERERETEEQLEAELTEIV